MEAADWVKGSAKDWLEGPVEQEKIVVASSVVMFSSRLSVQNAGNNPTDSIPLARSSIDVLCKSSTVE